VVVVLCIAILLVGVFVWRRLAGAETSEPASAATETELLALCLGDRSQMERLIALETKKAPGISRAVALDRAVHSMRRDRR
jgi:hypothetical protein